LYIRGKQLDFSVREVVKYGQNWFVPGQQMHLVKEYNRLDMLDESGWCQLFKRMQHVNVGFTTFTSSIYYQVYTLTDSERLVLEPHLHIFITTR
jgi:hypothetical protein